MEENSAAIECLILFYINMKHVLKTRQVIEKIFIDLMVKHCKENGFNKYSGEEIKNTWKTLTSKYLQLKTKGTVEEKENWKYFEILDSCYEQSDFHYGLHSKFSEEMIWFLIECFLKRKTLKKAQKHDNIVIEIHKEFLQNGYLYITKQDIENKWRSLNLKYNKLKNDDDRLKKLPYLQALRVFHEDEEYTVNMFFTRALTEILIERFTEKKITCVIHGYDSDKVLDEIQSEFKDLGFYFSKDDIKEKWRTLTNIYKFIFVKGRKDTTWIYFDAMKKHFKNDFLFPLGRTNKRKLYHEDNTRPRRLRQRSKSVGAELKRNFVKSDLEVQLEKISSGDLRLIKETELYSSKKRSSKRSGENRKRSKSRKKLKKEQKNIKPVSDINEDCNRINQENEVSNDQQNEDNTFSQLDNLPIDLNQERRKSSDLGSPTSKVHIININQSDIDQKSGNLTINLPSITKKFSDNECLPLKKRLRVDGDNVNKHSELSKDKDVFLGFPSPKDTIENEKPSDTCENRRLTEEEMAEMMERIDREKSRHYQATYKSHSEEFPNFYGKREANDYHSMYNGFPQSCLLVPKEEHPDNLSMPNYATNNIAQPPVVLVVIKVDGGNNPPKAEFSLKTDEYNKVIKDGSLENNEDVGKRIDRTNQQGESSNMNTNTSSEFIKVTSPKGKTIIRNKKDLLFSSEVCPDANLTYNNNETFSNLCNDNNPGSSEQDSTLKTTENEAQGAAQSTDLNHCKDANVENSNSIRENVIVYPTVKETKVYEELDETALHGPLPAAENCDGATELKILDKTSPVAEKVRLPVKGGGKLKEIFISPRELNKIAKLKPAALKVKSSLNKLNEANILKNAIETNASLKKLSPSLGMARVGRLGSTESLDSKSDFNLNIEADVLNQPREHQPLRVNTKFLGTNNSLSRRGGKHEEFDNESVLSEAVGDEEGLKDNLLATVIDFQEQNNQEFIEIKNLMKQNNLLQRETNRLLRLILEKK